MENVKGWWALNLRKVSLRKTVRKENSNWLEKQY